MDAAKRFQRWRRRLAKLRAILPGLLSLARAEGAPEHIHQLRVVLRRMRLLVRLGEAALAKRAVKRTVASRKLQQTLLQEQTDFEPQIRRVLQPVARLALAVGPVNELPARKHC